MGVCVCTKQNHCPLNPILTPLSQAPSVLILFFAMHSCPHPLPITSLIPIPPLSFCPASPCLSLAPPPPPLLLHLCPLFFLLLFTPSRVLHLSFCFHVHLSSSILLKFPPLPPAVSDSSSYFFLFSALMPSL